jgi:hypothetical protein
VTKDEFVGIFISGRRRLVQMHMKSGVGALLYLDIEKTIFENLGFSTLGVAGVYIRSYTIRYDTGI